MKPRVAFFSPLPPAKSGIADYSAALLQPLRAQAAVDVFSAAPERFDAAAYDAAIYQIGNNHWHEFAYEAALAAPGVTVLHEANLHHLLCDLTIRRKRWDLYLAEAEFNGGPAALAYARRVAALETGPDYAGLPMTRRLLEASRGVIVHSHYMQRALREQGYTGPAAVIPHGAWIPEVHRMEWREKLGLDGATPLIGVFGFLKPYKRIAQALAALRRLLRVRPEVKMVLVGEVHPELPLEEMIRSLGLGHAVRTLGFTPIGDFAGYLAACDIVLNLRYPTVGESSGTLLRALGLGRAVIVSDVGSFSEYPADICLKAPVDAREEDMLFEYLSLLTARPDLAQALGARAAQWVAAECSWTRVASLYLDFCLAVRDGRPWPPAVAAPAAPLEPAPPPAEPVTAEYVQGWAQDDGAREYIATHATRLERTLALTPPGTPEQRILELGCYMQITPALKTRLGYGEVRGAYYGPRGRVDRKRIASCGGEEFACEIDHFDAEKDGFPYPDGSFATVLCCELIEHLPHDPMHLMAEINRIVAPGGHLLLTTPNAASWRAVSAVLHGYHPGFFPAYIKPSQGEPTDARHAREYTAREVWLLLYYAGFDAVKLETGPFLDAPQPEYLWLEEWARRNRLEADLRGDGVYALGRKAGPVRERFPAWLYSGE